MEKHQRTANLQVVFVDIEKYSQRRTLTQIDVVDNFTSSLREAFSDISKRCLEYAQANDLNFQKDIIVLPTGDGSAVVFSFDGLHDIHLEFAKMLLANTYAKNQKEQCERFNQEGWCNCHPHFNLRVGVSEGKGIVYRDVNDCYNVAGSVVNMASRVMSIAERNQILFTSDAYAMIVDMVDDPKMVDHFVEFSNVDIKHGLKIKVYQYVDPSLPYLNSTPPADLMLKKRLKSLIDKMRSPGLGFPDIDLDQLDRKTLIDKAEHFINTMIEFDRKMKSPPLTTNISENQKSIMSQQPASSDSEERAEGDVSGKPEHNV
jgi:class 3 adenylate cyclase